MLRAATHCVTIACSSGRTTDAVRNRWHRLHKRHPRPDAEQLADDGAELSPPPLACERSRSKDQSRLRWSEAEDRAIERGVRTLGCRWRQIAASLPGRSDSSIRNRWHRLIRGQGADDATMLPPLPPAPASVASPELAPSGGCSSPGRPGKRPANSALHKWQREDECEATEEENEAEERKAAAAAEALQWPPPLTLAQARASAERELYAGTRSEATLPGGATAHLAQDLTAAGMSATDTSARSASSASSSPILQPHPALEPRAGSPLAQTNQLQPTDDSDASGDRSLALALVAFASQRLSAKETPAALSTGPAPAADLCVQ